MFVNPGYGTVESGSLSLETGDWLRMVTRCFEAVRHSVRFKDAPFMRFVCENSLLGFVAF
jgi:hypothetical protein